MKDIIKSVKWYVALLVVMISMGLLVIIDELLKLTRINYYLMGYGIIGFPVWWLYHVSKELGVIR